MTVAEHPTRPPIVDPPVGMLEAGGAMWCVEHHGISAEGSDYLDDDGEAACDMYESLSTPGALPELTTPCRIVELFYRAAVRPSLWKRLKAAVR